MTVSFFVCRFFRTAFVEFAGFFQADNELYCRQHTSILHGQKQPKNRNIHEVSSFEAVRLLRFAQIGGGAGGESAGD